jgi:hypothetical protein
MVLPLFTARKRPRQAVIAHPKDKLLSNIETESNTRKHFRDCGVEDQVSQQRIPPHHPYQPEGYRHMFMDGYGGAGKAYASGERLPLGYDRSQVYSNGWGVNNCHRPADSVLINCHDMCA